MNPTASKTPPNKPAPAPQANQVPDDTEEKKGLNLDLKAVKDQLNKALGLLSKHATFVAILVVLAAYLFVVFKISHLANAEPPALDPSQSPQVPKIDKKAVLQIQQLEQSNTQVHSLFNAARNNPFQE